MDTSSSPDVEYLCKWLDLDDASAEFWRDAPSINNNKTVDQMGPVYTAAQVSSTKTVDRMGPV